MAPRRQGSSLPSGQSQFSRLEMGHSLHLVHLRTIHPSRLRIPEQTDHGHIFYVFSHNYRNA